MTVYADIARELGVRVLEHEPLAGYTWLRVGGPASALYFPDSIDKAGKLFGALASQPKPVRVLGAGSNLVVADEGVDAAIVATREIKGDPEERGDGRVFAPAGTAVPGLARWAAARGLAGLEFAEGIPALLGGALRMNAGAHGSNFGAIVESLVVAGRNGVVTEHPVVAGDYAYRESFVARQRLVALGAVLRLHPDDPEAIKQRMLEYRRRRRETQPVTERSAGCVFANFPGLPIGKLVEQLGLKGTSIGDAEVSRVHGNFIVNRGHARASDYLALVDLVASKIVEATGEAPRREIEVWSDATLAAGEAAGVSPAMSR